METLNTIINFGEKKPQASTRYNFNREQTTFLENKTGIHIDQTGSDVKLNNGRIIGSVRESRGRYEIEFFDGDKNRNILSEEYSEIEKISEVAKGIHTGDIREYIKEVPKLKVVPQKRIRAGGLRMFQPIRDKNGKLTEIYIEMTNRSINGLTMIAYRKVSLKLGISGRWRHEFIQPRYLQITDQREQKAA